MSNRRAVFYLIVALLLCTCAPSSADSGRHKQEVYRIGALASRGKDKCFSRWINTARHLSETIPNAYFDIIPLKQDEIPGAVEDGEIDFIITDPASYVELENLYGAERIATLEDKFAKKGYAFLGGVIFTRADREDIKTVSDLKNKDFAAVNEDTLGGWLAAWREFDNNKINPYKDFNNLSFIGTGDEVVYAVLNAETDAAAVQTLVLEKMSSEGRIDLKDFKILNLHKRKKRRVPFLHSTFMYPQWSFARLQHADIAITKNVAQRLLDIPPDEMAAFVGRYNGWTVPSNYQSVHECMRQLHAGPYKDYGKITLEAAIRQHWLLFLSLAVFLIFLSLAFIYSRSLNTRLRKSQKALEQSQQHLEDVINFSPDAFFAIDLKGKITVWNKALEEMTGFKSRDMTGKGNYEYGLAFYGERRKILVDCILSPEKEVEKKYFFVSRKKDIITGESFTPDLKGRQAYFWITASPLYDTSGRITGAMESVRDITQIKKTEQALRYQAALAEAVADIASRFVNIGSYRIDDEIISALESIGAIVKADRAYVFLFFDNLKKMRNTHEWCAEGIQPQIQNLQEIDIYKELPWLAEKILRQETINIPHVEKLPPEAKKEKEHFIQQSIVSLAVAPILFANNVIGFLGVDSVNAQKSWESHTLTSLKILAQVISSAWSRQKSEANLRRAYEQLKSAQAQLIHAEKMEAIGRMASGVAHEVKNPLGIILQGVNYFENTLPLENRENNKMLDIMKSNIKRADNIVRALLDFSRGQRPNMELHEINSIIESSINLVRHKFKINNIEFKKSLGGDLPRIYADREKIEQVLINLFNNAVDAMPDGGEFSVSSQLVTLNTPKNGIGDREEDFFRLGEKALCVKITDTGAGMSEDTLRNIFDPFFTTKNRTEGTGLGLSVSKSIIDMHKGLINVESEQGKGSAFTILFKIPC